MHSLSHKLRFLKRKRQNKTSKTKNTQYFKSISKQKRKMNYAIAAIIAQFLSTSRLVAAIDTSNCEPLDDLGPDNLDRYNYSLDMDIDSGCSYELKIKFKHDETLPLPTSGPQCDPSIVPPDIAPDGLPYFGFRWAYESVPTKIKKATGIDHISIDFNPCGHPPYDVFTIPHYDMHIYLKSPEYRRCMTCTKVAGAPVCDPGNQSTPSGQGFLNVATVAAGPNAGKLANMPDGFHYAAGDNVPLMGGHAWDTSTQPSNAGAWVDPIWIMGPYDGGIIDFEPMLPLSSVVGSQDKTYEESLTYVGQNKQFFVVYLKFHHIQIDSFESHTLLLQLSFGQHLNFLLINLILMAHYLRMSYSLDFEFSNFQISVIDDLLNLRKIWINLDLLGVHTYHVIDCLLGVNHFFL